MLEKFMQAMADTLDGADPDTLNKTGKPYFDPKYVGVYRNNYMSAFRDALASNYPSVVALIGRDYFSYMAKTHTENHPQISRTMTGYGSGFATTIADFLYEHNLPYLASFAQLDRSWTLAHLASNQTALSAETLSENLSTEQNLLDVYVKLNASVQIVELAWPVFDIWAEIRTGSELGHKIELKPGRQIVLVWRYQNEVQYRQLSEAEHAFIDAIRRGENLGSASNHALVIQNDLDISTLLATTLTAELFQAL